MKFVFVVLIALVCVVNIQAQEDSLDCPPFENEITRQMREALPAVLSAVAPEGCDLAVRYGFEELKKGLSPFWAQQQIGADLTKAYLNDISRTYTMPDVLVANIDSGYSGISYASTSGKMPSEKEPVAPTHATQTLNILAGAGPFGVGYKATVLPRSFTNGKPSDITAVAEEVAASSATLVNLETQTLCILRENCSWPEVGMTKSNLTKTLNTLSKDKVVVAAAGNFYLESSSQGSNPVLKDTILVGSADESGRVSNFSDKSPDLTILAPSDWSLASPSGERNKRFGGTSGAAPMVTGALANVMNLIPGLTASEAKALLKKTATPLPVSKRNGTGLGLLNAYKLVRVADRLRLGGWPKNRKSIYSARLYDFKTDANALADSAMKLPNTEKSCETFRKRAEQLRTAFLLNPSPEIGATLGLLISQSSTPRDALLYSIRTQGSLDAHLLASEMDAKDASAQLTKMTADHGTISTEQKTAQRATLEGRPSVFARPANANKYSISAPKNNPLTDIRSERELNLQILVEMAIRRRAARNDAVSRSTKAPRLPEIDEFVETGP